MINLLKTLGTKINKIQYLSLRSSHTTELHYDKSFTRWDMQETLRAEQTCLICLGVIGPGVASQFELVP